MDRLQTLDMSVNRITDLTTLASLVRLRDLSANANLIVDLAPLFSLENLRFAALVGNRFSTEAISQQVPVLRDRGVEVILGE